MKVKSTVSSATVVIFTAENSVLPEITEEENTVHKSRLNSHIYFILQICCLGHSCQNQSSGCIQALGEARHEICLLQNTDSILTK
jgi:hypothetical protein